MVEGIVEGREDGIVLGWVEGCEEGAPDRVGW